MVFFSLYWTYYHAVTLQVYDHMMTHKFLKYDVLPIPCLNLNFHVPSYIVI